MSSQTRIDHYFKSTSGKQQSLEVSNRSKSGYKSLKKGPGKPQNFVGISSLARHINEENTWPTNSTQKVSSNGVVEKTSPDGSTTKDNSNRKDDSHLSVNVTTPHKQTIRGFIKACNSPPVNTSPEKKSLKRRTHDSPGTSNFSTKSQVFRKNNVINDSQICSTNNSSFSTLPEPTNSLNLDECYEEISARDIDNVTEKKSSQCHSKQSNDYNSMGKGESEANSQRKNIAMNCQTHSEENSTKISPKKRKIRDSSSSRNSASSSGWKLAISIETADVSMTALSSDWQKTLEASQELKKSSVSAEQTASKEYIPTGDGENNEKLSEKSSSARVSSCTAYPKKTSPRRALFSPGNSAKKMRCEESVSATSILDSSAGNSDASLTSEESFSPQVIFQSTKSITNEKPPETPKKIEGTANSLTKVNGASSMLRNISDSPKTPTKTTQTANSPTKRNEHLITPTKSPSKNRKSSFTPRFKVSPKMPRKERVDLSLATKAVENLNQAKQGIIPMNDFDLEMVYTKKSFDFEYGTLNPSTAVKYEAKDVQVPDEMHADHFFMVFVNVFSEALNCGYFNEDELDTIFSTLTLTPDAQSLLTRMLKRKRGWHRVSNIKYPEIANDLTPICRELVAHGFLDDDIVKEDISKLLNLLQIGEIKAVCQAMKRPKTTKSAMILDLVKLANTNPSLFPGMKSPSFVLREKIKAAVGLCIRLPEKIENLLNRIFILLIPNQDPKENMVEAFRMLIQVHFGERRFPTTPKERYPIFKNRLHLIRYAEARSAYTETINSSESKDWDTVRRLGQLARDNLKPYFESTDTSDETQNQKIPSHVKRFDPNYLWTKVMSKSVEAFKKTKEGVAIAAEFLHLLVSPNNKIPANRTRWYNELAMIESYHLKNFERSAEITLEALTQERISDMDAAEIFDRARKLCKSKAVSKNMKERINAAVSLRQKMSILSLEPTVNEIEATMIPGGKTGSKSTWSLNIGGTDTGYAKVEAVALRHYLHQGFRNGIHCEGALPVTLFAVLLWEEIYTMPVPGAFVSSYQEAPLDLYTSHFLESRRERIEDKLNFIRRLDLESFSGIMHEDYIKYREYESLVHGNLFPEPDDFKDLIECLGIEAVVGICERLAGNYVQWRSGFPDLALWNPDTKKCKIVEVKGPGDTLSTKQKMWIQFLETLGVSVEVCVVKGTTRRYAT